jgi:hypothetical protein
MGLIISCYVKIRINKGKKLIKEFLVVERWVNALLPEIGFSAESNPEKRY